MPDSPETQSPVGRRRGVVGIATRDDRLLVIRRSAEVVAPGAYCFPGGHVEAGETEEQALIRELDEELGVVVQPVRRLWQSVTPWQVELAWWSVQLDPQAQFVLNPAEVESIHWLTPPEMLALGDLLPSNRDFLSGHLSGHWK